MRLVLLSFILGGVLFRNDDFVVGRTAAVPTSGRVGRWDVGLPVFFFQVGTRCVVAGDNVVGGYDE
jgi:hypothetical protein